MANQKTPIDIGESKAATPTPNNSPWWAFWDWTMNKDTKVRWTAYQRTANEFLVYSAGYWAIIYLTVTKFVLPFFSASALTPLWGACLITGVATLITSIILTEQFYQLHVNDTANVNSLNNDIRDLVKEIRERNATHEKKHEEKEVGLTFKQQSLFYWDKIHTFLIDSYAVMSIASIFVFLITSVFGASVIHPALIIGAAVAVGYGIISTTINHSSSNSRHEAIQKSKNNFDVTLNKANELIKLRKDKQLIPARNLKAQQVYFAQLAGKSEDAQQQYSRVDLEHSYKMALADAKFYFNYEPRETGLTIKEMATELDNIVKAMPSELESDYIAAIQLKQRLLAASRTSEKNTDTKNKTELSPEQCKEIEASDKEEFKFNNWEKWDIFCAFIEFKAGSIIYLTLPIMLDMMGVPPLSSEIFWAIVIGTGVIYGLINGFYKIKTVEEEKWLQIEGKMEIPKIFDEVNTALSKPEIVQQQKKTESKGWLFDSFGLDADNIYQKAIETKAAFLHLFEDVPGGDVTDGSTPAPTDEGLIKGPPDSPYYPQQ